MSLENNKMVMRWMHVLRMEMHKIIAFVQNQSYLILIISTRCVYAVSGVRNLFAEIRSSGGN